MDQTNSVREAINKKLSSFDAAEKYSLLNMGHFAGLMYCILVVPRELALEEVGSAIHEEFLNEMEQYGFDALFDIL